MAIRHYRFKFLIRQCYVYINEKFSKFDIISRMRSFCLSENCLLRLIFYAFYILSGLELSHASTTVISHDYSEPTTNNKRLMEKLMRMSLMRVA